MRHVRRLVCMVGVFVLVLASMAFEPRADAEGREQSVDRISLGMSTALTGPNAHIGLSTRAGVTAAIAEVNRAGGIHGRLLRLVALDDGYEPERTAPNIRRLIDEDRVLAIIGNLGTPTAMTAIPIARASQTPFVGALTGADFLRTSPPERYVINYRASYAQEISAMVEALVRNLGLEPEEIAFFTERNAYGDAGFAGGLAALKRHGLQDENQVAHARYDPMTRAVENALADILFHRPFVQAVVLVGTHAPCAEFIRLARQNGLDVPFLCVSFAGTVSLAEALGDEGDGVVVTQVVPHFAADLPVVREYRAAMEAAGRGADLDFCSLEGYVIMRILCRALESVEGTLDNEAAVDALEALGRFDIGLGTSLLLDRNNHQACHHVWPVVLSEGELVPFDWRQLRLESGAKQ